MPEITFTIDNQTGETSLKIKGIAGSACKPFHEDVSGDLKKALGIEELANVDTDEMRQAQPTVTRQQQVRSR